jgi:hypothetical protein
VAFPIQPGLTIPSFALGHNAPALANSAPNPFVGKPIIEDRLVNLQFGSMELFGANRTGDNHFNPSRKGHSAGQRGLEKRPPRN